MDACLMATGYLIVHVACLKLLLSFVLSFLPHFLPHSRDLAVEPACFVLRVSLHQQVVVAYRVACLGS